MDASKPTLTPTPTPTPTRRSAPASARPFPVWHLACPRRPWWPGWRSVLAAAGLVWGLAASSVPAVAAPEIFRDADLPLGEQLLQEHACAACHVRRVGGDGSAIYRPQGRINSPGALRGMVELCSVELKLSLFPEEVSAVAAVLNRDHYRFGLPPRR